MKLSANFTVAEWTRSQVARDLGIPNSMPPSAIDNATILCERVLQPVRDVVGPIRVNSGYRSPALNKAVGGSKRSLHMHRGMNAAADVECALVGNYELAHMLLNVLNSSSLLFELILEEPGPNKSDGWVHVGLTDRSNISRVLTYDRGHYSHGLRHRYK